MTRRRVDPKKRTGLAVDIPQIAEPNADHLELVPDTAEGREALTVVELSLRLNGKTELSKEEYREPARAARARAREDDWPRGRGRCRS
jgi:hypothetical protein